jgi:hypothetical protein
MLNIKKLDTLTALFQSELDRLLAFESEQQRGQF